MRRRWSSLLVFTSRSGVYSHGKLRRTQSLEVLQWPNLRPNGRRYATQLADEVGRVADGGLVLGGVGVLVSVGPCATEADQAVPESLLPSVRSADASDRDIGSTHSTNVIHSLPSVHGQRTRS